MSSEIEIGSLIEFSDDVRKGRACIAGTGVTVHRIAGWYKLGLAPEQIQSELSHLNLAQIYAALAHYHANRDEIESDILANDYEAGRLEQQHSQQQN